MLVRRAMCIRRGRFLLAAALAAVALAGCTRRHAADAGHVPDATASPAGAAASAPPPAWTPTEFLRAVPRGTMLYASARGLDEAWDAACSTRLAPILADSAVGPLLSRIEGAVAEGLGLEDGDAGTIRALAAARIEIAVVDVEPFDASWGQAPPLDPIDLVVAVTDVRETALWRKTFSSLQDRWVRAGAVAVSGFRVGGWACLQIGTAGSSIIFCSSPKGWLFGTKRDRVEMIADRWGRTSDDALSEVPAFADARARAGSDPSLFVYADVQRLSSLAGIPEAVGRILDATGIGAIQAVSYGAEVVGDTWRERIRIQVPQESRGLLGAIFPPGGDIHPALRLIPERAVSASVQRIDAPALWASVQRIIANLDPRAAAAFHQGIASFETRFGVSVESDIFGAIGDTVASYATAGPGGAQESIAIISLRDAGTFRRAVQSIATGLGIPAQPLEVAGSPGLALAAPLSLPGLAAGAPSGAVKPCLVFAPSHAVFATSPGAAEGFLDHLARGGASIADRADWKKGAAGLPANGCGVSFADLGLGLRSFGLALAQASAMRGLPAPIDPKALPLERLAKGAGSALTVVVADARGIGLEIASETGLVPLGAAVLTAAAGTPITAGIEELEGRGEAEASEILRGLVPAQASFRARHGRYARVLSELAREGLVSIDLAEGIHRGYLIKILPHGDGGTWEGRARRIDGRGQSLVCDAAGKVRPAEGLP
ncbi:MAG: hypothetical protein JXP34_15355 [Planctomycetes bacterium]|nr:hypothetical protein [Planctomycetota bacterium]